jgi:uncharacterized protein involved in exopolysaccharide biosynthesis
MSKRSSKAKPKKRNPNDATLRNVRAASRKLEVIRQHVAVLIADWNTLEARVSELEKRLSRMDAKLSKLQSLEDRVTALEPGIL